MKIAEGWIFFTRAYEVSTGINGALEDFNEVEKFGKSLSELSDTLDHLSWWRPDGGFHGTNFCNELKVITRHGSAFMI